VLKWLLGRRAERPEERDGPVAAGLPDGRLGPEPPPPPSANRPGVTVHPAAGGAAMGRTAARSGASRIGRAEDTLPEPGLSWAAVVLSGEGVGDVVVSPGGRVDLPPGTAALLDGVAPGEDVSPFRIRRDELTGTGVAGVSGARVLARTPSRAVLRLGPPPGARWAVVGFRSVAVFVGKLTLVDGDEGHEVRAGEAALVADPTATLYLQAGNDAAVAIGFAEPGVLVRLG